MAFVYAWIVPLWVAQLLPQLLMEQFDTLRIQCDPLNICMKEFIIFVCTDSTEIFISKLRSGGLNYNLQSFFTESKASFICTLYIPVQIYTRGVNLHLGCILAI